MRAFRISAPRTPPGFVDLPVPAPAPGEVGLRVTACGLNFADLLMIKGTYQDTPAPPFTMGLEMAGVITALGHGVTGLSVGDRVACYAGQGGLAEAAVVDAARCVRVPDTLDDVAAAGFLIAYGTSHLALDHVARLRSGDRLLVLGAAGGVGLTAVEIGALMGAEVVAVARGDDKLAVARAAGASHLIDATDAGLRDTVKALGGADVVFDAVGGDLFDAAFRATNPGGRIVLIGFASGDLPQVRPNHMLVKNISLHGVNWGGYLRFDPDTLMGSLGRLMDWATAGKVTPHVSHVLPFDRVEDGLEMLRARTSTGKVVIAIGDQPSR